VFNVARNTFLKRVFEQEKYRFKACFSSFFFGVFLLNLWISIACNFKTSPSSADWIIVSSVVVPFLAFGDTLLLAWLKSRNTCF
jgi:hypothetical protein